MENHRKFAHYEAGKKAVDNIKRGPTGHGGLNILFTLPPHIISLVLHFQVMHLYILESIMKNIMNIFAVTVFVIGTASLTPPPALSGEVESCLAMIEKMVGVEPTEKVKKLCKEGKSKDAMQAAMMGE